MVVVDQPVDDFNDGVFEPDEWINEIELVVITKERIVAVCADICDGTPLASNVVEAEDKVPAMC